MHDSNKGESDHILERLKDRSLGEEERLQEFGRLLLLLYGWWQGSSRKPQTLRAFVRRAMQFMAAEAVRKGVRANAVDVEDLCDETLWTFFQRAHTIRTNPRRWLLSTAKNKLMSEVRRQGRRAFDDELDARTTEIEQPSIRDEPSGDEDDEDAELERRRRLLRDAIKRLRSPRRDVLQLYYYERKSDAEIAAILRITRELVRQHLVRGRQQLKAALRAKAA